MRIRSIRPEFWSSEDIAEMDWHTRLVYIGLWSYVDDNGVGRDKERLVTTALFPLDDNLSESSVRVHRALKTLQTGGQITRYTVNNKPYLHITAWERHQKINRPTEGRYPLPTCENAVTHDSLTEDSVSPHADAPLGEGEKGRRGEGLSCSSADAESETDPFDTWWAAYPRKVGKGTAAKAYRAALKKTDPDALLAAIEAQRDQLTAKGPEFCPYPATWLNGQRWEDQAPSNVRHLPSGDVDPTTIVWPTDQADWMGGPRR